MENKVGGYFPDESSKRAFMESTLETCKEFISHYTFVINDISSEISNPELQRSKGPAITFLKAMRAEWERSRDYVQTQLDGMKRPPAARPGTAKTGGPKIPN